VTREIPRATGWAVDISGSALEIARENARVQGVCDRISFVQGDLLECFSLSPIFDLILCNPPYIARKDYGSLPSCVRDYEPHRALFGGESGLEIYERLAPQAASTTAHALIYNELLNQAALLAIIDTFQRLAVLSLCCLPLVLLFRRIRHPRVPEIGAEEMILSSRKS